MDTLTLRLLLPPLVITVATLAQGRLGDRAGGLLVGLPLTSGTFLGILLLTHGRAAVAEAASGMLAGQITVIVMGVAYAYLAPRAGVVGALIGAVATWAGATTLAHSLDGMATVLVVYVATAALALTAWPKGVAPQSDSPALRSPWVHNAGRIALGSMIIITLTAGVQALGPQLAGTLSAAPLVALVLSPSTHRHRGPASVRALLHGVVRGSVGAACFAVVVTTSVQALGGLSVLAAVAACLATVALLSAPVPRR